MEIYIPPFVPFGFWKQIDMCKICNLDAFRFDLHAFVQLNHIFFGCLIAFITILSAFFVL